MFQGEQKKKDYKMNYVYSYRVEAISETNKLIVYYGSGKQSSLNHAKKLFARNDIKNVVVSVSPKGINSYTIIKEYK